MSLEAVQTEADVDLREYVGICWRRKWLILTVFFLTLAACYALLRIAKPEYTAESRIVVEAESQGVNLVDGQNPLGILLTRAAPDSLSTQLQVMQTGPFQDEAKKRVKTKLPAGAPGPDIHIENVELTQIIAVKVKSGHPKHAAELANSVVDLHLERSQAQSLRNIREAKRFVERETAQARAQLIGAEQRLMSFRKVANLERATEEETMRVRTSVDLESRVRQLRGDMELAASEVRDLRARLAQEPEFITNVTETENPQVQKLRDAIADVEQKRVGLLVDFKETSPVVKQLDVQLADLTKRLEKEPLTRELKTKLPNAEHAGIVAKLRDREDELRRLQAQYNRVNGELMARTETSNVGQLGVWEVQLAALKRERDQAERRYAVLTERLQDLQIREKAGSAGARPILRATPPGSPSFPNPPRMLLVAAVMGLLLGIGCAFLSERMDDRVHTPEEAERLAHVGLLAHVPQMAFQAPRLVSQLPAQSPIAESYRALRSSISFAALDAPIRTLLVTSVARGEGKSTTAVNLATSLAMDGKKVILIDADMRRPSVHSLLQLERTPGLSEVLYGKCRLEEVIHRGESVAFDVVCCGSIPSHPAELLNTRRMEQMLEKLTGMYDVVMLDTPPCVPVTDALILATQVDGVVLVVDTGKTRKGALRHARELLDRARARVLGVVFNRAGQTGHTYYGGKYGSYAAREWEAPWRAKDDTEWQENEHAEIGRNGDTPRVPARAALSSAVLDDEDDDI